MKPKKQKSSRRSFIKTGVAASSIFIVPRNVLGGKGYTAPSDQLHIAAIGAGGKGRSDINNSYVRGREKVVALCDVDFSGDAKHSVKKFPKAKLYDDYRKMLDKQKSIDAVTISTPDHVHAPAGMYAMERGKHVYIQKPMAHNIREARLLTEMARKQKVVTQMGNQGASNPYLNMVHNWVDSGKLGKITDVKIWTNRPIWPQGVPMPKPDNSLKPDSLNWNMWLGPAKDKPFTPYMHPFSWRGWWEYGTGALGDVGCHLIDIPFRTLNLKYPTSAECSVGNVYSRAWSADYNPEGCPPSSFITISFDETIKSKSPIKMTWSDGGIRPSHPEVIPANNDIGGKNSENGVLIIGENFPEPEYGHQRKWVDACKAGFNSKEHQSLTSSFDYAGPMTETVLMGNLAIRSYMLRDENTKEFFARKKLLWDGDNMKITNLEAANQFVTREYRKGFEV